MLFRVTFLGEGADTPVDTSEWESFWWSSNASFWQQLVLSPSNRGSTLDELSSLVVNSAALWFSALAPGDPSVSPTKSSAGASPKLVKSSAESSRGNAVISGSWHEGMHLTSAFDPPRMEVRVKSQIHSEKMMERQQPRRVSILRKFRLLAR